MTSIKEVIDYLEKWAPTNYQEDYDNSGLIIGNSEWEITGIVVSLDVTEAVVKEAITKGANLIIAHHPIVFKGLKRFNGSNYVERTVIAALKSDIAIYAIHTNLDHVSGGVNWKIAEKLGLNRVKILSPKKDTLLKLTTFVPKNDKDSVLEALFDVGAGNIGNYENCSFTSNGIGAFKPQEGANPAIGAINVLENVEETKVEVILASYLQKVVLKALFNAHPYEEVSYFLTKLENENQTVGAGAIGDLPFEMNETEFLTHLKKAMGLQVIKYTSIGEKKIQKIAICGGSGSFLLKNAIGQKADAFVTADYKYHEFFDSEGKILIADIGHYESEVFTKELIQFYLSKKFSNFATLLSEIDTNPIKYYI